MLAVAAKRSARDHAGAGRRFLQGPLLTNVEPMLEHDDPPFIIETQLGHPLSIRQLVVNYLRAVERFRLQYTRSSVLERQLETESLGYAALAEALGWADSIDNYLRAGPKNSIGTSRDEAWASSLPADQEDFVLAFQRVRNLVHHRWWQALATSMSSDIDGAQVNQWIWGSLPVGAGQGRGRSSELDAAYASRLRGADLLASLDKLAAVFWSKRRWQIVRADIEQPGHEVLSKIVFDDE